MDKPADKVPHFYISKQAFEIGDAEELKLKALDDPDLECLGELIGEI